MQGGGVKFENVASRFSGLSTGPNFLYTFETQTAIPIDGTNALRRSQSPFTIRVVPPAYMGSAIYGSDLATGTNVNLLGSVINSESVGNRIAERSNTARGVSTLFTPTLQTTRMESVVANGQLIEQLSSGSDPVVTLVSPYTLVDAALQLTRVVNMPPLTLLVSPTEMNITYGTVQEYSERGREGKIFQRHGETQPTISFSGSTGAFISGSPHDIAVGNTDVIKTRQSFETPVATGVQFASKRDSAAFQNFMSLYHFYRNNGYLYDSISGSTVPLGVGSIAIDYDQVTYIGHIDSFSYSYDESTPNRIMWDMEFTVAAMYDVADTPLALTTYKALMPNPSSPEAAARQQERQESASNCSASKVSWGDVGGPGFVPLGTSMITANGGNPDINNLPGSSLENWRLFTE